MKSWVKGATILESFVPYKKLWEGSVSSWGILGTSCWNLFSCFFFLLQKPFNIEVPGKDI